jgi:hypothetical protein
MLHFDYDFCLRGRRLRVVQRGVLFSGVIMVYLYYEFSSRGKEV